MARRLGRRVRRVREVDFVASKTLWKSIIAMVISGFPHFVVKGVAKMPVSEKDGK
jgi:hypothetical protein